MSSRSLVALSAITLVAACATAAAPPPAAATPVLSASSESSIAAAASSAPPSVTSSASASVAAAPSASVALLPVGDVTVPPLFAALFEEGRSWTYSYTFDVDGHGVDPPGARDGPPTALKVSCKVTKVSALRGARVAVTTCSRPESTFTPPGELDEVFVATADGLWLESVPPETDQAVAELVAKPPWMRASPVPFSTSKKSAPGVDFPFTEGSSITREMRKVGAKSVATWCRRDFDTAFYGHDSRRCIAPSVGVVYRFEAGRGGPSTETATLLDTRVTSAR